MKKEIKKNLLEEVKQLENAPNKRGLKFLKAIDFLNKHYRFRYNTVSNTLDIRPITTQEQPNPEPINENSLFIDLKSKGMAMSMSDLRAYLGSHYVEHFNPIRTYYESLELYTESTSIIDKLSAYVQTKDQARFALNFKKALIRTVHCALDENYFNKQCLVLVSSSQNIGKSTFIRWLCPKQLKAYFTENVGTDKDSLIAVCENFIVFLDELVTTDKHGINKLKSLLSKVSDKSRRPYDARAFTRYRNASFWASTNEHEFLTDTTGNVRWVPFDVTSIDFAYSTCIDIDKVWAEAYTLYKAGVSGELTKEELIANEKANRAFMVLDEEFELIPKYYHHGDAQHYDAFYTATDMLDNLNDRTQGKIKLTTQRIGRALKFLGFTRESKFDHDKNYTVKGYYIKYVISNIS